MKGLTSIELAILLAIILVIAVAVDRYMYTTFLSSTSGTPRLSIVNAIYWTDSGTLTLTVQNPGPVATVYIQAVYLQGQLCSNVNPTAIAQASGVVQVTATCPPSLAVPGSTISGQVVLTGGITYPFTAQVRLLSSSSAAVQVPVTVKAVDGFGRLRTDWRITISVGDRTIASGNGQVTAYLPYGSLCTVTVATTVKTILGRTLVNVTKFTVTGPTTYVVKVPSAVISASAVDSFGAILTDAYVLIIGADVASGTGSVSAEVLAGEYTVMVRAYDSAFYKSVSVSPGQTANVQIVVPTAKIEVRVIDQAKGAPGPWTVQIHSMTKVVASGTGSASATVLALDDWGTPLRYVAVAFTPFGKFSTDIFTLKPGEIATKTIVVPTAILRISAVDDNGYPIDDLVLQTDVYYDNGTLYKSLASTPVEVEVLGDQQYIIKVTAQQGHIGTYSVTPPAGQTVAVRVRVPGTAGITLFGVRIPMSQLVSWLMLMAAIAIIVIVVMVIIRRMLSR